MQRKILWHKYVDKVREQDEEDGGGLVTENPIAELIRQTKSKQFPLFDPDVPFEYWTAVTDFDVDADVRQAVVAVPGIEIYNDISKYRFQISIPPTFFASEVLVAVEKALNANQYDAVETEVPEWVDNPAEYERLHAAVKDVSKDLSSSFPFWHIYIDTNGKFHVFGSQEATDTMEQLKKTFLLKADTKGGYFFESSVFN